MTVKANGGGLASIECDSCGSTLTNTTVDLLLVSAANDRWKVLNVPGGRVEHYCAHCGAHPSRELAVTLRNYINQRDLGLGMGAAGAQDPTGLLESIVVGAAERRGAAMLHPQPVPVVDPTTVHHIDLSDD